MCGILGFMGYGESIPEQAYRAFEDMFIESESRGRNASGIGYLKNGKLVVSKGAMSATNFLKTKEWAQVYKDRPTSMIAHTRLTTQGSEKFNENNHPVFDPKFGWGVVHNGTIWNDSELFGKHKLKRDGKVDSEIILRMFQKYMVEDVKATPAVALKRAVRNMRGAMTFAMLGEERPDSIYFYKGVNPLVFAVEPEWKVVFFASKLSFIEDALTTQDCMSDFFYGNQHTRKTYKNTGIKDGTLLCVTRKNGEVIVRTAQVEQPKEVTIIHKSGGHGWGKYERDIAESPRKSIGVGYHQNQDGTIERDTPRNPGLHEAQTDFFTEPEINQSESEVGGED